MELVDWGSTPGITLKPGNGYTVSVAFSWRPRVRRCIVTSTVELAFHLTIRSGVHPPMALECHYGQ